MAVTALDRLAARGPVPVLPVAGAGGASAAAALAAHDGLVVAASPRHASVLVIAGALPPALVGVVGRLHDQVPEPRGVVWWGGRHPDGRDDAAALGIDGVVTVAAGGDVTGAVRAVHHDLLTGRRPSTPPVGPAANPVAWQGVGPHGQGGEGMMGGRPYGRPMAMTGEDGRDGLALDRVALPVGPALPGLPPGLRLDLELQGDVIVAAQVSANPFADGGWAGWRVPTAADPFDEARSRPVRIVDLELARARWHLLALSQALGLHGLAAPARRVARLAGRSPPPAARLARMRRWLLGAPAAWGATAGVGRLDADAARSAQLSGVAARAAGVAVDARADDPAYQALGFAVRTQRDGDAGARWRQRAEEAQQALALAETAGQATAGPNVAVEDPRADSAAVLAELGPWLVGQEWGDAVTTIASLDVDLERAAGRRPVAADVDTERRGPAR